MQSCNQKDTFHSKSNNQNLLASMLQEWHILVLLILDLTVEKGKSSLATGLLNSGSLQH